MPGGWGRADATRPSRGPDGPPPRLGDGPGGAMDDAVHPSSNAAMRLPSSANSTQATPWRPKLSTYRCFLSDLTGFGSAPPHGTQASTPLSAASLHGERPRTGIQPRYSGLRVQGTASSPFSTALSPYSARTRTVNLAGARAPGPPKPETGRLGRPRSRSRQARAVARRPAIGRRSGSLVPSGDGIAVERGSITAQRRERSAAGREDEAHANHHLGVPHGERAGR